MKKILLVVGCRPDCIKMIPLYKELKKSELFNVILLSSGQHNDMINQVFDVFNERPDFDLSIMKQNQDLFDITEEILNKAKSVLKEVCPDLVLVHGDTSTAFAFALSCFYLHIPVGHVEAGLRTHDIFNPFPEEFNRQAIGLIATYHFAPTYENKNNLLRENKEEKNIFITGNTIVDSIKYTVCDEYTHPELEWVGKNKLIFVTVHRREIIGEQMINIFNAIKRVADENDDIRIIYPVHPNPKIRSIAANVLGKCNNIHLINPLNVIDSHNFESRSYLILTDSGGIQEEALSFGVPTLVLRERSERFEGIDTGVLKLVGTNEDDIYFECTNIIKNENLHKSMCRTSHIYGDGTASIKIVNILKRILLKNN